MVLWTTIIVQLFTLSLDNKLKIYKTSLKPLWMYGTEIWDSTSNSNIQCIKPMQSIILIKIIDAPMNLSNNKLYNNLYTGCHQSAIQIISQ